MTFDEMFAQAKALLENASAKDTDTAVSIQFDVSGDGCGAFYAVVSADSDKLTIEPFDYKDHDVLVSADSAALLDALRTAETAALELAGEWEKIVAFRSVLDTLPKPKKEAAPKAKAPAAKKAPAKPAAKKAEAPKTAATVKKTEPVAYKRLMSSNEANLLGKLMKQVVDSGTASALSGRSYTVAGKTGSAEFDEEGHSHSWFIGYSNVDDPDLVVAVIVENGGSGSEAAVPIAGQIFDAYHAS